MSKAVAFATVTLPALGAEFAMTRPRFAISGNVHRILNQAVAAECPELCDRTDTSRSAYVPVKYRQVGRFLVAIASVDYLSHSHRNRELRSIRESHQDFFPELGVFIDRQFGNELADDFWEFKFWI